MPSFPATNVLRLSEMVWPISWRWMIQTPFGPTSTVLSVEAPQLEDKPEASARLGKLLYMLAVAPATTMSTHPSFQETVCWKNSDVPFAEGVTQMRGMLLSSTSSREDSAVLVMRTGHPDPRGSRQFHLGGIPASWSSDGMLNETGARQLQTHARGLLAGMVAGVGDLPYRWVIAYPRSVPISGPIGQEVSFRYVQTLRVCQYTSKAPELSGLIWPQPD